jgi:hypothetical protein
LKKGTGFELNALPAARNRFRQAPVPFFKTLQGSDESQEAQPGGDKKLDAAQLS